jgi:hypothetical protein
MREAAAKQDPLHEAPHETLHSRCWTSLRVQSLLDASVNGFSDG